MSKRSDFFKGKYLKALDLPEEGITLTIDFVDSEEIGQEGQQKETKPVIHFKEEEKALVCNLTNFKTIEKVTGEDNTDNWTGHQITLYPTEVEFKGDTIMSIRVRLKTRAIAKAASASAASSSEDDDDTPNF